MIPCWLLLVAAVVVLAFFSGASILQVPPCSPHWSGLVVAGGLRCHPLRDPGRMLAAVIVVWALSMLLGARAVLAPRRWWWQSWPAC